MINYDSQYVAEIAKEIARVFWLVEFQLAAAGTQRWTDADIPLPYSGQLFLARPLKITGIQKSPGFTVDSVSLEISNIDRVMSALLLGEDCTGKIAILRCMAVNSARREIATAEMFRGIILGWGDLNELRAPVKLGNEFMFWRKKTLRLPTPSCPWVFKGVGGECAYAGSETWCDQSPERCAALGNYLNFGGRKYISAVEDQKIYWGPKGY